MIVSIVFFFLPFHQDDQQPPVGIQYDDGRMKGVEADGCPAVERLQSRGAIKAESSHQTELFVLS